MEETPCVLCGYGAVRKHLTMRGYQLSRCPKCSFIYTQGIGPEDLDGFYEKDYFDGKLARWHTGGLDQGLPPSKLWLIAKYFRPRGSKNILEIGPSISGGMIKAFRGDPSRTLQCVEISEFASAYLNENGIPTFHGTVEQFETEARYDLVMATEVIEHTLDPHAFVASISALMSPGGLLFLSTGNTSGLMARHQGAKWYYYDPPAHVSYFSNSNIRRLLASHGFTKVSILHVGFQWMDRLLERRWGGLMPLISSLHIATGMFVFAEKQPGNQPESGETR